MEYQKIQSVAKQVLTKGPALDKLVLETAATFAEVVGSTLGPGGMPVLIERQEFGIPATVTKDGVTAFKSLGFENAAAHCVMETARGASVRTATEAGDGTTTATILVEALIRHLKAYCKRHPRESAQKVVRRMETVFRTVVEPNIKKVAKKVKLDTRKGQKLLRAVAKVSANGDEALADAVMQCFEFTGDEGSINIVDAPESAGYFAEALKGYMIPSGYGDSCRVFSNQFIANAGTQTTRLDNCVFLLYYGRVTEVQTLQNAFELVGENFELARQSGNENTVPRNIIVVATDFSDSVLATLATNFTSAGGVKVLPVTLPLTAETDGGMELLNDLAAVTGATVLDPITRPAESAVLEDLGPGIEGFEFGRAKSTIFGYADEEALGIRIEELNERLQNPDSILAAAFLKERKAKLAGGVARLRVGGSSHAELREKKDRAEDAVCAVRGAIKKGVLPAGGWTLLKLNSLLPSEPVCDEIIKPAFAAPFFKLLTNCGIITEEEQLSILAPIVQSIADGGDPLVYDFLEQRHVSAYKARLLDSVPAVLEAIRTSISVASQLGTLAAIVVFARDKELERSEARATAQFMRDANVNEANERP